jgi:hypothetical protein
MNPFLSLGDVLNLKDRIINRLWLKYTVTDCLQDWRFPFWQSSGLSGQSFFCVCKGQPSLSSSSRAMPSFDLRALMTDALEYI